MNLDFMTSLYVFMLAAFIGFEVIRRVSPLLHTPLMSLTNALDAIAVVGAIILAGRGQEHARDGLRNHRDRRRHEQRRGRVPDHRPHAQDVQGERPQEARTAMIGSEHIIELAYLVATALFILALKWMSSPSTARRGVRAGELGMLLAIVGTLFHHEIVDYTWIAIALVLGSIIGVPLGMVQMTAVPQRTALSHAFGALCVTLVGTAEYYLHAPDVRSFHDGGAGARGDPRLADVHGQPDGRGKLQEVLPQRPITFKGQNVVNLGFAGARCWRWPLSWLSVPGRTWLFPLII